MYFDAHSDIWTDVTVKREHGEKNVLKNHHLDRLRAGQVEGSIFVIWVERPDIQDYAIRTAQIKQAILDETAECDDVQIVHTVAEMKQARDAGKFYIWIGIEGMAAIGDDVSKVDEYYNFGCRHGILEREKSAGCRCCYRSYRWSDRSRKKRCKENAAAWHACRYLSSE